MIRLLIYHPCVMFDVKLFDLRIKVILILGILSFNSVDKFPQVVVLVNQLGLVLCVVSRVFADELRLTANLVLQTPPSCFRGA